MDLSKKIILVCLLGLNFGKAHGNTTMYCRDPKKDCMYKVRALSGEGIKQKKEIGCVTESDMNKKSSDSTAPAKLKTRSKNVK